MQQIAHLPIYLKYFLDNPRAGLLFVALAINHLDITIGSIIAKMVDN